MPRGLLPGAFFCPGLASITTSFVAAPDSRIVNAALLGFCMGLEMYVANVKMCGTGGELFIQIQPREVLDETSL